VNKIVTQVCDPIVLQHKASGMPFGCSNGTPRRFTNAVNNRARSAFFSSAGVKVIVAVAPVLMAELNCDKCQSDERWFFTVKSNTNKGQNATKTMLKTKFPTPMFHQQS